MRLWIQAAETIIFEKVSAVRSSVIWQEFKYSWWKVADEVVWASDWDASYTSAGPGHAGEDPSTD